MYKGLNKDIITAMKNEERDRLKVLRGLKSDILLEAKGKKIEESAITDDMFLLVAKRVVNSANKAIEKGGDNKNDAALLTKSIVSEYLPEKLNEKETVALGEKLMAENEFGNFGDLIRAIQKESKGNVDGKIAAKVSREIFKK